MAGFRSASERGGSAAALRRLLLAIVVLGLLGTGLELVLLEHYEDSWQLVPLFFIATALAAIGIHVVATSLTTVRLLRALMGSLIVVGLIGIAMHYQGNLEFQLEMDASQSAWQLFTKAIHAKAPPALAPGVMAQLGLLGLLYTYRHPAARREGLSESENQT